MKAKRILSILLCAVMLVSAIPAGAAFAADESDSAYCEIKFRNPEIKTITFGETEELYLEYSTGGAENCKIEWEVSDRLPCKVKYITDEETGLVTSVKLTARNFGDLTLTATILDENGNEIASAKKTVRVVESEAENKTFKEKVKIFFRDSYLTSAIMTMYFVVPAVFAVVFSPVLIPYYAVLTVRHIIVDRL